MLRAVRKHGGGKYFPYTKNLTKNVLINRELVMNAVLEQNKGVFMSR